MIILANNNIKIIFSDWLVKKLIFFLTWIQLHIETKVFTMVLGTYDFLGRLS